MNNMNTYRRRLKPNSLIGYAFYAFGVFGFAYLSTILVVHWDIVNTLIFESSLAKYEIMSGQRGPTTYLICHNDLAALQEFANAHDGVLGVEQHIGSNVAKMAFVSAKSSLIQEVGQLAVVSDMINRNVPMLCH